MSEIDSTISGITPYGILKTIRYMVNSTAEFLEVIFAVNHILGTVNDKSDLKHLSKSARFDVLPLPHSQSKFIACFDVPSELLGLPAPRKPATLDYGEALDPQKPTPLHRNPPRVFMSFSVDSLFDINLALYEFEAALAPSIPSAQWARVKRSIQVMFKPRQSKDALATMIVAAHANPASSPETQSTTNQPG